MITTISFEQQRFAFYCRNALLFSSLLVFTWACKDECRIEPATCHVYEEGNCDLVLELNQELVTELSTNIHPISGSDPNLDVAELYPMDNEFADAYFVGLGEATHGSKEFFEMKDRIFRYLSF